MPPVPERHLSRNPPQMADLSETQKRIIETSGHLLVTGGPGSGKTTISILKAAKIAHESLRPGQKVLFLSFARATVSRVLEAIEEERQTSPAARRSIEVDTYHSFFWRILKAHGYLIGFPRRLSILTPPNEGIALSSLRGTYKAVSKLTVAEKAQKLESENAERARTRTRGGAGMLQPFRTRYWAAFAREPEDQEAHFDSVSLHHP